MAFNFFNPFARKQQPISVVPKPEGNYPAIPVGDPVLKDAQTGTMVDVHALSPAELAANGIRIQPTVAQIVQRHIATADPEDLHEVQPDTPAKAEESTMANKFVTVMEKIGAEAKTILADVVKFLPAGASLASIIFPKETAVIGEVVTATSLIQNAVAVVEQKYAASGVATGTGVQKLAEVLTLTQAAVTDLLNKAGIAADASYVTKIVDAVVAILNVQAAA